jgi:hypothetical protein
MVRLSIYILVIFMLCGFHLIVWATDERSGITSDGTEIVIGIDTAATRFDQDADTGTLTITFGATAEPSKKYCITESINESGTPSWYAWTLSGSAAFKLPSGEVTYMTDLCAAFNHEVQAETYHVASVNQYLNTLLQFVSESYYPGNAQKLSDVMLSKRIKVHGFVNDTPAILIYAGNYDVTSFRSAPIEQMTSPGMISELRNDGCVQSSVTKGASFVDAITQCICDISQQNPTVDLPIDTIIMRKGEAPQVVRHLACPGISW